MDLPVARTEDVNETLYGISLADPYRWMENWKGEELQSWVKSQGAYTQEYLKYLPERDALLQRITQLGDTAPTIYNIQVFGGRFFYQRRDPGENMGKLVVRTSAESAEKVLFNPNTIQGNAQTSLDWYAPSSNGQYVAYGISQGGSEESTLDVLEGETGTTLDP